MPLQVRTGRTRRFRSRRSRPTGGRFILLCMADKRTMIRNRYNQIPYPALNTKRKRDTYNLDGTKQKAQVKSQGDSSFPTDGHKAILNKLNSKSKTNIKRTNIDN